MKQGKNSSLIVAIGIIAVLVCLSIFTSCTAEPTAPTTTAQPTQTQPSDQVFTLKLADCWPSTNHINTEILTPWIKDISDSTNGRVKVELFDGGTLLGCTEVYSGVIKGTTDIGHSALSYAPGSFPMSTILELPGVRYNNAQAAAATANDFYNEFKPEEFKDVKIMFLASTGPGVLISKKPVRSLEDMKGLQVRSTGSNAPVIAALGATPVAMPQPDVYVSLQKGVLDANLTPAESIITMKYSDFCPYLTVTPSLYVVTMFFAINQDSWNKLPDDLKNQIESVNAKWQKEDPKVWDKKCKEGIEFGKNSKLGLEIIYLPDNEWKRWEEKVLPVQTEYIKKLESEGLPAQKALQFILSKSDEYNKKYPVEDIYGK